MTKSILLVGVGGQGTILSSKILTEGLLLAGYDVKMNEIHGMSQRGGAVSSQIRYGETVQSPVIEVGSADLLVAFEKMEAARNIKYLKAGGKIIVNDYEINSMPIIVGLADYPNLNEYLKNLNATFVDGAGIAKSLGNGRVMNIVLLGIVIESMKLSHIDWEKIIRENVKSAFVDINITALKKGMELVCQNENTSN